MAELPAEIRDGLQADPGLRVDRVSDICGGCIHQSLQLETDRGAFFLKYNRLSEAGNFVAEAQGLDLLASTETLRVPEVIALGQGECHAWLLMEYIEPGRAGADFWGELGRGLAQLHQHTADAFGLDQDNYIGSLPQKNDFRSDWLSFFLDCRIAPMLRGARDRDLLDSGDVRKLEGLGSRLEGFFPKESPALIHGDLWGGNLLTDSSGSPVLIDPAVYYGHREMEIAFMSLFDSQPDRFYSAYQSGSPLESAYRERFDIYNLYPLLVHLNLFGRSYLGAIRQILHRF